MAIRLDKAFGGGAETWLRLQAAYDLAKAQKYPDKINVQRVAWSRLITITTARKCPHAVAPGSIGLK